MKKQLKRLLWFLVVVMGAIGCYWHYYGQSEKTIIYQTHMVQRGDVTQSVSAVGDVSASQLISVGAQATGQIQHFYVSLGQAIQKGDLIAEIDATTQQNAVATATSRLASSKAQLAAKQLSLKIAKDNYAREKALWAKDATSRRELQSAKEVLKLAEASIVELQALIKQAEIALNTAKVNLGYTRIVSPMTGTVVSTSVEAGQTLNAAQSSPTLVQIADLSKMLIKLQIAEGDATKVKPGMTVRFTTLSNPDDSRETVLNSVDPGMIALSRGRYTNNAATSTGAIYYYGRALVDNPDGQLHVGMTIQSTIVLEETKDTVVLPSQMVQQDNEGEFVQMYDAQGNVIRHAIQTGLVDNLNTQILSGLSVGDKVIIPQSQQATDSAD